ncbi:hypothetical protein K504DRAFT_396129 [Pleomassaria siparia CBS 279.74]|uniref:S-adenosyl-L-methionine-dependent methyltransferase n=1 Tax=Pleomassaria siparia CBS 279.74 TaxID=1314801 RepID=A0A6G1KQI7_9PLEO|nr:hypothetical protein K504DRAFT_396129 [Pleomassaria siparia CBS 279.74]
MDSPDSNMDSDTLSRLTTLRRQYFQLVEPSKIRWPDDVTLIRSDVQSWMFNKMFDVESVAFPPPEEYQLRALKLLIAKLEGSIFDPEKDEISDDLMSTLAVLFSSKIAPESTTIQQKAFVTYEYPSRSHKGIDDEYRITVLESRLVLASAGTTGLRTWEASLLLASFLTSERGQMEVVGKRVFELGSGSGMLSILCAKYLGVSSIVATDGNEGIVDALKTNIFLNKIDSEGPNHSTIRTAALKWGWPLNASSFAEDYGMEVPDVVLGADVTYDKYAVPCLVSSLRELFDLNPALQVLIAATIRNEQTFEVFQTACKRNGFSMELIDFPQKSEHQQDGPFISTSIPIQIWRIANPQAPRDTSSY